MTERVFPRTTAGRAPVDPSDPASPPFGGIAEDSPVRQGEILDFLEDLKQAQRLRR
jgi:hypothetical protein